MKCRWFDRKRINIIRVCSMSLQREKD